MQYTYIKYEAERISILEINSMKIIKRLKDTFAKKTLKDNPDGDGYEMTINDPTPKLFPSLFLEYHDNPGQIIKNEFKSDGFDLIGTITAVDGPIVEIGGPTPYGYDVLKEPTTLKQIGKLTNKKVYITNISATPPGQEEEIKGRNINLVMDGQRMPLSNDSVAAIFISHMVLTRLPDILSEVARVLKPDGVMVIQGIDDRGVAYIWYEVTKEINNDNVFVLETRLSKRYVRG